MRACITHLLRGPSATRAEDRDADIRLSVECPADVASSIVGPVTAVELQRFTAE